ncbi:hypothetical protein I7I48_05118 [Histoplasma ohiense]|nr:hypothetical protein I7I48_05118 [Histoplasma ohiense (nom. inval.)]
MGLLRWQLGGESLILGLIAWSLPWCDCLPTPGLVHHPSITFSWISNSYSESFLCQYYDDPEILWLLVDCYWQKKKSFDVDIGGYLKGQRTRQDGDFIGFSNSHFYSQCWIALAADYLHSCIFSCLLSVGRSLMISSQLTHLSDVHTSLCKC